MSSLKSCLTFKINKMKKRKTILFSLASLLIMLLILGQQEIEKSRVLLSNLTSSEVNDFVFTAYDFARIVKDESTPLVALVHAKTIEELMVAKCRTGENVFLQEVDGHEIVLNSYGDAGIIQYELERGGKIIANDKQKEIDYFQEEAVPMFQFNSFSSWDTWFYFLKRIGLILAVLFLPFFLTIKMLIFLLGALIIWLSLSSIKRVISQTRGAEGTTKECCLNKAPPGANYEVGDCQVVFENDGLASPELVVPILTPIKVVHFGELIVKVRKAINKIFHVPKYGFVVSQFLHFNHFNKIILVWKILISLRTTICWAKPQMP